jgi:hypothetical protein
VITLAVMTDDPDAASLSTDFWPDRASTRQPPIRISTSIIRATPKTAYRRGASRYGGDRCRMRKTQEPMQMYLTRTT